MVKLTIDGKSVAVAPGAYVLDAARLGGAEVPTLCHLKDGPLHTSCMMCLVRDVRANRLIPSCSVPAVDGMEIETHGEEIQASRRATLDLLLSEHTGDCDAPCERGCPAHMEIPRMIRAIAGGDLDEAIRVVKKDIALPSVVGRICPAPCEKICRRKQHDEAVSICLLKRWSADGDRHRGSQTPPKAPPTGKRAAVVGAGPAGLAAAFYLARLGHGVTVFDDHEEAGGTLRYEVPEEKLPRAALEGDIAAIRDLGVVFAMGAKVDRSLWDRELAAMDAVILATGIIDPELLASIGVATHARGVQVSESFETSRRGVFSRGTASTLSRMAIRSMADGKELAQIADRFIQSGEASRPPARFNSQMGKLFEGELERFLATADASPRHAKAFTNGEHDGFSMEEARKEALRCLHCDCRARDACGLREHATAYGARRDAWPLARRGDFTQEHPSPDVLLEQGKCVKCGICVRLSEKAGMKNGFTFVRRGYEIRVEVPWNGPLDGREEDIRACVDLCPTGALAYADK
ncbi:MAG: (2Fe-2S)-binding protein [Spirochaetes bacterium]|nr:(2Fe-2S)-binding protein [Spirochaetota bacterium]